MDILEIELALVKLYEITNEKKYIDMAKYFIDERGKSPNYFLEEQKSEKFKRIFPEFDGYSPLYSQSHLPVREQKTAEGHAVRAVYMYCAMADLACEYNDSELFKACEILWKNIVDKRMYITGSIGSSGLLERFTTDYDLPNDSNYSETCASIGLALFGLRMAKITRKAKYIDVVERALYNTVISGISMDGKSFFYVNPLEVWPDSCLSRTSKEHVKPVRQKWFGVACCPPNIARTLASLGQYIYMKAKDTLYINLFVSNTSVVELEEKNIYVELVTDFPNDNNINLKVSSNNDNKASIAIRIPDYAENFNITINGKSCLFEVNKGFAVINGSFNDDIIKVKFDSPARFMYSNPLLRADFAKVAITKGPLVYCLEEVDNGSNLSGIMVNTAEEISEIYDENLLGGTTLLYVNGKKVDDKNSSREKLYLNKRPVLNDIKLKAIPYCYWGNRKKGEMIVWMKADII